MTIKDYTKKVTAKSYFDLMNIIHNDGNDLRENYIFRGLEDSSYKLVPSALREVNNKLSTYIGNDFKLPQSISIEDVIKDALVDVEDIPEWAKFLVIEIDKDGKPLNIDLENQIYDNGDFQVKKELYVLLKFLNFADKSGLKITDNYEVRSNIHNYTGYNPKMWPEQKFIEVMSLAQHYGLPTQLLDWSYDYKVALYFSLKDIVTECKNSDGIIWAFNYKIYEKYSNKESPYFNQLRFYRPEYNRNPYLKAQKGLFTYIIDNPTNQSKKELNKRIIDEIKNKTTPTERWWCGSKIPKITTFDINDDDILFYRIKIPKNKKSQLLNELYADGYSEEYLFPDYKGAILAMENKIKLENLLK